MFALASEAVDTGDNQPFSFDFRQPPSTSNFETYHAVSLLEKIPTNQSCQLSWDVTDNYTILQNSNSESIERVVFFDLDTKVFANDRSPLSFINVMPSYSAFDTKRSCHDHSLFMARVCLILSICPDRVRISKTLTMQSGNTRGKEFKKEAIE